MSICWGIRLQFCLGKKQLKFNASSCISFCFIIFLLLSLKIVLASPGCSQESFTLSFSQFSRTTVSLSSLCPSLSAARRTPILFYTTYMPAKLIYVTLYLVQVPLILHISSTEIIYYTTDYGWDLHKTERNLCCCWKRWWHEVALLVSSVCSFQRCNHDVGLWGRGTIACRLTL